MSRSIWLLSLAAFMAAATTRACDALLPNIAETFAVPISSAAAAITAFTLAYGLFQLVYGPIGARIGPYRLVVIATALAASGAFVCSVADSLTWLTAGRFWSGLTAAAIIPMSLAHIGNTVAYEDRQAVIARFLMGQVFGLAFGQAFAGLFADLFNWRQLFIVLGFGFLLVALALAYELRRGAIPKEQPVSTASSPLVQYLRILGLPWARVVLVTVTIEGFLCFGAFPFIAAQLKLGFNLDYLTIGLVMSGLGLGGLIYILGVRWLLKKLGETGLARGGGAILLAGFGLAAIAPYWYFVIPATILIGLGFYMFHNTLQTNATQMAPFDRSSSITLFAFVLFGGQALGALLLGHIGEVTGYVPVFLFAGIGLMVLAWLFAFAKQRQS
jgi:predicted MFS family arabinose efflux permease